MASAPRPHLCWWMQRAKLAPTSAATIQALVCRCQTGGDRKMKIVLLDAFTADQGRSIWPGLDDMGQVDNHPRVSEHDLYNLCVGAEAVITNKAILTAALLQRLSPTLKYVGISATGTNIVDVEAARRLGIAVT